MGIRDGDPAVLHALVRRRGAAVLAYCERACAPDQAFAAAADAFVRFRAQILAAQHPGDIDPETALLSATRHAAASRTPRPPVQVTATGLGRLLGGKAPTDRLPEVPSLLADRADGSIAADDDTVLEALLDASPVARAVEERFAAAEEAYRLAPRRRPAESITDQLVATMGALAAAPATGALAAAPTNGAPSAAVAAPVSDPSLAPPPRFLHDAPDADPEPEPELLAEEQPIPATRGDGPEVDPAETVEWTLPADELGESPGLEHEIAAARMEGADEGEDPARRPPASGAVPPDDVPAPPPPARAAPPAAHPHHHRPGLPGRAALAPAAAVVAIAAIGAMAAAGVFGGNDPSPTVDTGIVPERALQAVPEGEASAVIDDLRSASADARRRRRADRRRQLLAEQAAAAPAVEQTTTVPEGGAATGSPTVAGQTPTLEAGTGVSEGPGGASAEDATGGGTESP